MFILKLQLEKKKKALKKKEVSNFLPQLDQK